MSRADITSETSIQVAKLDATKEWDKATNLSVTMLDTDYATYPNKSKVLKS